MIKYNPDLFFVEYVRIKRITSTYLYVTTRSDGRVYKSKNSKSEVYKGRNVSKIRIHETVANQYFKNHSMKEFKDLGQFACIAFYEDIVIGVEVQSSLYTVKENQAWVATIDKIMSDIYSIIPENQNVFINGKEIFWLNNDSLNNYKDLTELSKKDGIGNFGNAFVSKDGSFQLKKVKYLELSKIGVTINKEENSEQNSSDNVNTNEDIYGFQNEIARTIGFKNNISLDDIANLNFDINYVSRKKTTEKVFAFIKDSYVMSYNPYANEGLDDFDCYSPILIFNDTKMKGADEKRFETINKLLNLKNSGVEGKNSNYLNLNFLMYSGKLIGELYGYEETEILKIAHVIKDTGVVTFDKILPESRMNYPINLMPLSGFAWLFRFVNKEQNLNKQRDLSNLFMTIFTKGFIQENKIKIRFKEGMDEKDIKMLKYKSMFN